MPTTNQTPNRQQSKWLIKFPKDYKINSLSFSKRVKVKLKENVDQVRQKHYNQKALEDDHKKHTTRRSSGQHRCNTSPTTIRSNMTSRTQLRECPWNYSSAGRAAALGWTVWWDRVNRLQLNHCNDTVKTMQQNQLEILPASNMFTMSANPFKLNRLNSIPSPASGLSFASIPGRAAATRRKSWN